MKNKKRVIWLLTKNYFSPKNFTKGTIIQSNFAVFYVSLHRKIHTMKTCWQLFVTFLNIGAFTIGGGYAMLDMIERAVVKRRRWIEHDEFWESIAIVQSLPGVFAVNCALYAGYKIKGTKGAIASCLGAMIPSIVIMLLIAMFFTDYKDNSTIEKIFRGIRPCVVALILSPAIKMCISAKVNWKTAILPIATVILICWLKVSPAYIILSAIAICIGHSLHLKKITNKL